VAKFYIGSELPGLGVNTQDLIEFGTKLESHGSYRAHVSDMSGASVDMTWRARCRPSSILAFDLLVELQTATNPSVSVAPRSSFPFESICYMMVPPRSQVHDSEN